MSQTLITISYLILSLGLISAPFFILKKLKKVKWFSILLSYTSSLLLFLGTEISANQLDRWLYEEVRNSGWIMDALLTAGFYNWLLITILFIISPFIVAKIKYSNLDKKRILISFFISVFLALMMIVLWIYVLMAGARTFINFN